MNRSIKHILKTIILLAILLFVAACTSPPADPEQLTPVVVTMVVTATPVPTSTLESGIAMAEPTPMPTATPMPTSTPAPTYEATVTYPWLNMREGPGSWYPLVVELDQGTRLVLLAAYNNCSWLQVETGDGASGWVIANDEYLDMSVACEELPPGVFRPATSVIHPNLRGGGAGELEIRNETEEDSLVVLSWNGSPVYAAYIRSQATFYMTGIADGNYELYFSHGTGWDGKAFLQDESYWRFENQLDFESDEQTYTVWTITLHGLNGGGTPDTLEVPEGEFPRW